MVRRTTRRAVAPACESISSCSHVMLSRLVEFHASRCSIIWGFRLAIHFITVSCRTSSVGARIASDIEHIHRPQVQCWITMSWRGRLSMVGTWRIGSALVVKSGRDRTRTTGRRLRLPIQLASNVTSLLTDCAKSHLVDLLVAGANQNGITEKSHTDARMATDGTQD